jgi:hypothetical protein
MTGSKVLWRIFWQVAWLVLFITLAIIIGTSASYMNCIHERKGLSGYQTLHARADEFNGVVQQKLLRLKLQGACASKFAEDNEHAIGALSAVALAIFTFYLWRATRGLRNYAEIQASDMRQLVRLARANALAGMRAAKAARTSANAAMTQANIAERSFFDLERPYLFVDSFNGHLHTQKTALPPGTAAIEGIHTSIGNVVFIDLPEYFNSIYTIKNWGRTPAIIYEQQFYVIFAHALPSKVGCKEPIMRGEHIVGPGEVTTKFPLETYHFTADEKQNFINGTERRVMFLFGFIRYKDVFGNKYIRGHAMRYLRRANRFVAQGGDTYNYERKENESSSWTRRPASL